MLTNESRSVRSAPAGYQDRLPVFSDGTFPEKFKPLPLASTWRAPVPRRAIRSIYSAVPVGEIEGADWRVVSEIHVDYTGRRACLAARFYGPVPRWLMEWLQRCWREAVAPTADAASRGKKEPRRTEERRGSLVKATTDGSDSMARGETVDA